MPPPVAVSGSRQVFYNLVGGFNPLWKILVKIGIFPKYGWKLKKYLKPPPSNSSPIFWPKVVTFNEDVDVQGRIFFSDQEGDRITEFVIPEITNNWDILSGVSGWKIVTS